MIVRPEVWITEPDEKEDGLLKVWAASGNTEFPFPVETHHVSIADVTLHEEQNFGLILECAAKPDVYRDEEAYMNAREHHPLASESAIPVGLFSPPYDARILLNGKVVRTYADPTGYGFDKDDVLYSLSCLGNEYDAVLDAEHAEGIEIEEGNIVSCLYWVQGWPEGE